MKILWNESVQKQTANAIAKRRAKNKVARASRKRNRT